MIEPEVLVPTMAGATKEPQRLALAHRVIELEVLPPIELGGTSRPSSIA